MTSNQVFIEREMRSKLTQKDQFCAPEFSQAKKEVLSNICWKDRLVQSRGANSKVEVYEYMNVDNATCICKPGSESYL
jgi:hypothetical protein